MRNRVSTVLLLVMALSAPAAGSPPICGDVNNNGKVTAADALAVLKAAVGQQIDLICPVVSQLPRTGQTVSYGSGSDGNVQAGAARQFTDNSDGTITDSVTALMWEKNDRAGGIHDQLNTYSFAATGNNMDGTMISDHLAALNAGSGFAGHTDWRIPNVTELESLKNYDVGFGAATFSEFDTGCDPGCTVLACSCTRLNSYWTSTTHANDPTEAWTVGFNGPGTAAAGKLGGFFPVRAVRNAS